MSDNNFIATAILIGAIIQTIAFCFGIFIGWCVWG